MIANEPALRLDLERVKGIEPSFIRPRYTPENRLILG